MKITPNIQTQPVTLDPKWNHLLNLQLADPEFGKPGNADILLGADIFSLALLHDWRFGPPGTPSALKTIFGWVVTGTIHPSKSRSGHQGPEVWYFSSTTEEHLLKRFCEVEDYSCRKQLTLWDCRGLRQWTLKTAPNGSSSAYRDFNYYLSNHYNLVCI